MEQLGISYPSDKDMLSRFWIFHRDNPHVYTSLLTMALRLRSAGRRAFAIESLFGVLRWERAIETSDDSGFKLNDHYTAFYARMLMEKNPALVGFFKLRTSAADRMFEHPNAEKLMGK
jgi:hypothetical protein